MVDEPNHPTTNVDANEAPAGEQVPEPGEQAQAPKAAAGIASLASDNFSVLQSVGGVRGIVESLLPELAFLVLFIVTRDLMVTIVASLVICAIEFIARLIQRQTIAGALTGTIMVLICLFAAYKSNDARNYYLPACIINAVWALALGISLAARRPGIGYFVELIANPPTENLKGWYHDWHDDADLRRAYTKATWLWVGMFVLRDAFQVPLWLMGNVYILGTVTLVLGVPLFALVCWVSYLIIAGPRRAHKARLQAEEAERAGAGDGQAGEEDPTTEDKQEGEEVPAAAGDGKAGEEERASK